jgi:cytoskeletal protein CcmA (bactofilin family)
VFAKNAQPEGQKRRGGAGISMLGEGCSFRGKMLLRGETRLGGHLEGLVLSDCMLIIEETAEIKADIQGVNIQIAGNVEGDIHATGVISVTPKARIRGSIDTPRLIVEDGAVISGRVDITNEETVRAIPATLQEAAS